MARHKLTRAERYKRNYGLIRNRYYDSKLAKKAQTWSDQKIYDELGINVTNRKTPTLKPATPAKQTRAKRELYNYQYARGYGLSVKESNKLKRYKKEKIDTTDLYLRTKKKRFTEKNRITRIDQWSIWSENGRGNMPPFIEKEAKKTNLDTIVGGRPLEHDDHFGYIVEYYRYCTDLDDEAIFDLVSQDPHDNTRVIYKTTVSV